MAQVWLLVNLHLCIMLLELLVSRLIQIVFCTHLIERPLITSWKKLLFVEGNSLMNFYRVLSYLILLSSMKEINYVIVWKSRNSLKEIRSLLKGIMETFFTLLRKVLCRQPRMMRELFLNIRVQIISGNWHYWRISLELLISSRLVIVYWRVLIERVSRGYLDRLMIFWKEILLGMNCTLRNNNFNI